MLDKKLKTESPYPLKTLEDFNKMMELVKKHTQKIKVKDYYNPNDWRDYTDHPPFKLRD